MFKVKYKISYQQTRQELTIHYNTHHSPSVQNTIKIWLKSSSFSKYLFTHLLYIHFHYKPLELITQNHTNGDKNLNLLYTYYCATNNKYLGYRL